MLTRLIRPNHARTSLILLGVGKFLMDSMYLSVGLIPSEVMTNPANSTVSLAKLNFSGENTIPFWLQ